MYADFFGLRELPFNNTPDPRFFYATPDHDEALASLIYAVEARKGFVLLTGEVGAGKTMVSRMMLRHFGGRIAFANINHAVQDAGGLMESVCTDYEIPFEAGSSHAQLTRKLHDFLLARFAQDTPVVLVLDEAQTLPDDAFEQLRMIGNLEADDAKLLQIVILGQPELQQRFASPELRQLKQRIFRIFHLAAMDRPAAEGYIRHRLSVAGAQNRELFDADAIDRVVAHAKGLPRLINSICDNAMLSAYSADRRYIDGPLVSSVFSQMMTLVVDRKPIEASAGHGSFATITDTPRRDPIRGEASDREDIAVHRLRGHQLAAQLAEARRQVTSLAAQHQEEIFLREREHREAVETASADPLPRQLESISHHLEGLERRFLDTNAALLRAEALQRSLEPTLHDAQTLTERVQDGRRELASQENRIHQLAAKMRATVDETRRIHEGLARSAAKTNQAERSARGVYEKLVEQTDEARDVAAGIATFLAKVTAPGSIGTASPAPSVTSSESSPKDRTDADRLQRLLSRTRESLSDLRQAARGNRGEAPAEAPPVAAFNTANPVASTKEPATGRLARSVEGLLDLIKTDDCPLDSSAGAFHS